MKVIGFINQKGGVGKTTITANFGARLSLLGYRILLIDLDSQCSLTYISGADESRLGVYELLTENVNLIDIIQKVGNKEIIAASPRLASDAILSETGKEYRLKEKIDSVVNNFDFILIDAPPSLGILTINALTAATGVIVPMQADVLTLKALGQFKNTFDAVKRYTNKELQLHGLILSRYNGRTNLSKDVTKMIEKTSLQLMTKIFSTTIRESVVIKEAQSHRVDIFDYDAKSSVARDFENIVDEFLKDMKEVK
jgi:chromosome partitioning protein